MNLYRLRGGSVLCFKKMLETFSFETNNGFF